VYFRITSKLFPKVIDFQMEINPNKAVTILTIEGSGIIKKIMMQVTENDNSWINMIIDGASYTNFVITKGTEESNSLCKADALLKLEAGLDAQFLKNFSILIHNRSKATLNSSGKVFYEIKKP
jgi:hypothetical protein